MDEERCWICRRTKQEVLDDTHQDGELLFLDGTDKEMKESAFVKHDYSPGDKKYNLCIICHHLISMNCFKQIDEEYILD